MGTEEILITSAVALLCVRANYDTARQVFKHRTVDGLSMMNLLMVLWCCSMWAAHGVLRDQWVQVFTNVLSTLVTLAIYVYAYRLGTVSLTRSALTTAAWVAFLGVAIGFKGMAGYEALLIGIVFVMKIPQTREVWINPGGLGVSVSAQVISVVQSILWVSYGVVHHDAAMISTSIFAAVQSLYVVIRTLQGRRRRALAAVSATQPGVAREAACVAQGAAAGEYLRGTRRQHVSWREERVEALSEA